MALKLIEALLEDASRDKRDIRPNFFYFFALKWV